MVPVVAAAAALLLIPAHALDNGLGLKPAMGHDLDYQNPYAPGPGRGNASYIMSIADWLVKPSVNSYPAGKTPLELGYQWQETDSSWDLADRAANGSLVPDPSKYPHGLKPVVDYLHSRGLKFGLYGDRGNKDCDGNPGQLDHWQQDADFLAAHEIDWFKMDSCSAAGDEATAIQEYGSFRDALNKTGRQIWFALCGWKPWYAPPDPSIGYKGGKFLGNSWRTGPDTGSGWQAVLTNVANAASVSRWAGRSASGGGWNDGSLLLNPGMGCPSVPCSGGSKSCAGGQRCLNGRCTGGKATSSTCMTLERSRSMFHLWCVLGLNLIMTGNLPLIEKVQPEVTQIWLNSEAIAVDQDAAAWQPDEGRYGMRLDGGNGTELPGGSRGAMLGSLVASHMAECGGEPSGQVWLLDSPAKGYIRNPATNQCLSLADCKAPAFYDACETDPTRLTCAGKGNYSHFQWTFDASTGLLHSWLRPDLCAEVEGTAGEDVTAAACDASNPMQVFAYSTSSQHLTLKKDGHCLTINPPPAPGPAGQTSVYGRPLSTGGWALVLLNDTPEPTTITCGQSCFAKMNLTGTLALRDLSAHKDLGTVSASAGLSLRVDANGTSAFVSLTPQ